MTTAPVRFETLRAAGGLSFGRATLDAPDSLNALSLAMVDRLDQQLSQWADDPEIAGVLLDAVGDKAFCAGGDVVGLYRSILATPPGQVPPLAATFFEHEYRLDYRIHRYPKPLVCWGHGIVMGGGVGLLAGASHRVVTPGTRMAMPEISIGLYPDVGGSWLLPRAPGRSGLFLALTGASINAVDACFAGLADFVVAHDRHESLLAAIATTDWQGEREADAAQLGRLLETLGATAERPVSPLSTHAGRIDDLIGDDGLEDVAVRLAALAGDPDPWLARAGAAFGKGSPTSAALAFELQRRGRRLSLADVFRLEWQASIGCCLHGDFAEGVRALLIDKDKQPRWQPATLAEVGPEWVEAHLRSHFEGAHPLADLL
ncbi:MAG: enoyl-CoA hydratase/isomerase family protein [Burkholderiaceae bacterium]